MSEKLYASSHDQKDQQRYFNILERIAEGYFEVDISGHFTFSNAAFSKLTGYSRDELLGSSYRDFLKRDMSLTIYQDFNEVFKTGVEKVLSYGITQKGGNRIYIETSVGLLRDNGGRPNGFYGVMRDRSKQYEREIKYRTILENMEEGYYEIDLKGNFTYANASTIRLHGYLPEELMGMNYKQYLSEDTGQEMFQKFVEMYETRQSMSILEYEVVRKDGSIRSCEMSAHPMIDTSGVVVGFWGLTRDRTDRKQAEIALQQSETCLRSIFENAAIGIVYYNAQGSIIRVNQGFCDIVGYTSDELLQMKASDVEHPDDRDGYNKKIKRLLEGEQKFFSIEKRLVRKDSALVWCKASISAAFGDIESPMYLVAVFEDITAQKKMESQLSHAQKMQAIGTLAGGVAHDFNNLLMGIQGNVSLTMLDMDEGHPNYQQLKNIEQYIKAGTELTLQLLGAAKGGKYQTKPTDLNLILESSANLFARTRKEITIHKDFQKNLWTVEADQGQIEQVLLNLYVNAWQAMPGGGKLDLESKNVHLDETDVKPYGAKAGKYVRISVTDTGVGIEEKHLKRIFDPFFTTKSIGRGTGLGLASAYGIIASHGGMISAHSEKGSGATFTIHLPATCKKIIQTREKAQELVMGHETVLYVDDEEGILEIGEMILKKLGYRVFCAEGGKAAVDLYRRRHAEIDVVILDMIMPDQSGSETFNEMKRIDPGVRVILSSGYSLNGQAKEIIDRGCRSFIQKPFNIKKLSLKLRQVLDNDA